MAMWRKRVLVAAREPGPMHARTRQVLLLFKKRASRAIQSPHEGTANYTSRLLSHRPNWPTGSRGSKQEESR